MKTWFFCKAKYFKINELGKNVKVTEHYLVDAITFIDAETIVNTELEPYITGDFMVTAVSISNISELVLNEEKNHFYKCKIGLSTFNEISRKEKVSNIYILVQADSVSEAYGILDLHLSDSVSDFEILNVDKTGILGIFPSVEVVESDLESDFEEIEG